MKLPLPTKISYLISHPIQYFTPLFRQLSQQQEIDLTVYYCSDTSKTGHVDKGFSTKIIWDIPLLGGYRHIFLNNLFLTTSLDNRFWSLINFSIVKSLFYDKSDIVIIHGWGYFTNFLAVITAKVLGKQVWLRGENPFNQEVKKPKLIRMMKKIILQFGLFKLVDRFLYIGSQNRDFYIYYGVKRNKFLYAPYCVDNTYFKAQHRNLLHQRDNIRKHYNVPLDCVVILFSGKFIQKKRPLDLLKAYALLKDLPVALIMVGEGELRKPMEDFIVQSNLKDVLLTGFINQSEIGKFYSLADIFVLPSGAGETWGLVVNEAMLFQLPIVVSNAVGCAGDLVVSGENGFIFKEGDVDELARRLSELTTKSELRKTLGDRSGKIIENFDYSVMVNGIKREL